MEEPDRQWNLYRLLVENSLGLMCIHGLDGVLVSINPAVAKSLGYRAEDGPGRNLRDFLHPRLRHLFDDYLTRIARNKKDSGLMRLVAKDGSERIWMYRNTLYEQPDGKPYVLGHALDVTDRIQMERRLREVQGQLRRANDELGARVKERTVQLQQANERLRAEMEQRRHMEDEVLRARKLESLGLLAGGIAHDFNNFLTVVQGNVELARRQLAPGEPIHETLDQLATACQRAALLSSQLLIFATGGAPVRRATSMARVVLDAVDLARAGSAVLISADLADDLWAAEVDAAQISQVLQNVLLNAKQAMRGGGTIEVRAGNVTTEQHPGRYVKVAVSDHGCGIPADDLLRVFDPYFTTKPGGHGLGLATAYAIVSKHGGHIGLESKLGEGTTVTIELPASSALPECKPAAPVAPRGGSGRLLVMDDEPALRRLLQQVLEALGYEVQVARDGAEAIAIYEQARAAGRCFDAVLLDLTVSGGMGGVEAASLLRRLDPGAKLIVSSGYSGAPVMSEFRRYGFDDMIPKPWALDDVGEVFRRVLAR